jgi:hypothetical protein
MKMNKLVITAAFIVALASAAPSAFAITSAERIAIKKAVTSVPVAEMPAKAAQLVKDSKDADREGVAVAAVRAGIYKSRSSARLMVSAVVKAAPEVAAAVTREASEMEAGQAGSIASAAISAAPTSAKNDIVIAANRGVTMASGGSTTIGSTSAATPTTAPSPVVLRSSGISSSSGFTGLSGRGAATAPASAPVTQTQTPINTTSGGSGNGTFTGAGATPAGNPVIVDYTAPRT